MTVELLNHNGGPPLEETRQTRKRSVRTAWARALFDDPETPTYVMAMAWVLHWYSNNDGTGAVLSNEQFERICNISRPTVTKGKEWLRKHGYVHIKLGDGRGVKSTFTLTLPEKEKGEKALPLSKAAEQRKVAIQDDRKEETVIPEMSFPETTKHETSLQKGETSFQKGETPLQKGATTFPLNQDINQDITQEYNQNRARTRVMGANLVQIDGPREGEEQLEHGVIVNCETVRHPRFSVSIKSIAMQIGLANLGLSQNDAMHLAREAAISWALQWAAEIENGKAAYSVLPRNPATYVATTLINRKREEEARKAAEKKIAKPAWARRY